jgi:hypothetical protein
MTPKPRTSIVADSLLRGILIGSGLSREDFAKKVGISVGTLRQCLHGWKLTPRIKRRIEAAFGRPVWTDKAEFDRQRALVEWLQFNPFLTPLKKVIVLARAKGISSAVKTDKAPVLKIGVSSGMNPPKTLIFARIFAAFDEAHPAPRRRTKRTAEMISTVGTPPPEKTTNPK